MDRASATNIVTLVGWNQVVKVTSADWGIADDSILRVTNYEVGSKQEIEAPDYITGASDRLLYKKGPVTVEGSLSYPVTLEANQAGGFVSGFQVFKMGATLSTYPTRSFTMIGGGGETIENCKIQTCSMSCDAEGSVECQSTVWGVSTSLNESSATTAHPNGDLEDNEMGGSNEKYGRKLSSTVPGNASGITVGSAIISQIPMWDAVKVKGAPKGMFVTGFKLNIDNSLKRNYTMGTQAGASPYALNATSITAGQRKITGSVTWQSDVTGSIASIIGAGMKGLSITIEGIGTLQMLNCIWSAAPIKLNAGGERVVCESSFTALGIDSGFNALTIT